MKRFVKRILTLLLAAAITAGGISLYLSSFGLTVSKYTLTSEKIDYPFRVVQLTDLHNSQFGRDNSRLVEKVLAQEPDLILITGDLLNQNEERTDVAESLIRQLSASAPVCVSFGNHEAGHERRYGTDLRKLYTDAGAVVLEYGWQDMEVNGQPIRLGGFYGYGLPKFLLEINQQRRNEYDFLYDLEDTDRFTLLMCHMPVSWIRYGSLDSWKMDCVFAGHDHGGQVRIPFVGGVWAPDQGWFPGQESGLYYSRDESRVLVLSRGLGNTDMLPRFNNIPEIVTVDFLPAAGTE